MASFEHFYLALDHARENGRLTHELHFFHHFDLSISNYRTLIAECKDAIGENALTFDKSSAAGGKWNYLDEGLWTHNVGTFYFDLEEDAVVFRLKLT